MKCLEKLSRLSSQLHCHLTYSEDIYYVLWVSQAPDAVVEGDKLRSKSSAKAGGSQVNRVED